jgi:hypothetical protein
MCACRTGFRGRDKYVFRSHGVGGFFERDKVMENKAIDFQVENGNIVIKVDSNRDGQPLLVLSIAMSEIPDEVFALIKK